MHVKKERNAAGIALICNFGATCLGCVRLICKDKYEIFRLRERKRKREPRYVWTGAARFTIGHRISNRLDSSYPSEEEGEKYLALKERERDPRWKTDSPLVRWIILTVIFWEWTARVGTDNSPPALSIICDIEFPYRSRVKPWKWQTRSDLIWVCYIWKKAL